MGTKKQVYCRNGVREYLVWQTFDNRFSWFQLQAGEFALLQPDDAGTICSSTFPGLWLNVPALLKGNMIEVLRVLQAGIADPAHRSFVERLP